ncbi:hypothetical protein LX73_2082 [Fodinibius salinus]|uniref:Uncharacterized protein n=1 Tax=Fodinibius salinus TaxID=860790 RepID=A0A5D3YHN7_9BACT|nr:hypothetical protein [Fodinibius salinus]TYP92719.1 hypothetical protein LX73_2082 [Fodinibius salinus]
MNRQTFQKELNSALGDTLLPKLDAYVEEWFGDRRQLTRYLSALERKGNDQAKIEEGVASILGALGKLLDDQATEQLLEVYQLAVGEVTEPLPSHVHWQQNDDRFISQDEDSLFVAIAKGVKGIARSNPENWQQKIPLQQLVAYHLYNVDFISSWHQQLQRVQLEIITEIEELLVTQTTEEKGNTEDWTTVADTLKKKLDDHEQAIRQRMGDDIDKLKSQINQAVEKTGTLERRPAYYREARTLSRRKETEQKLQSQAEKWTESQQLLHGRTELMLELLNILHAIFDRCSRLRNDLKSYFSEVVTDPLNDLHGLLQQGKKETSVRQIHQLKEQLMQHVDEQIIGRLKKDIEQQVFTQKAEHFYDDLLMRGNQASQEQTMLHDMDLEKNPPEIDSRKIDWRLLVVRQIREQLVSKIQPLQQQYVSFLAELLEDIRDISNVIDVNLESAVAVEDDHQGEKGEDTKEVAREALERLLNTVEELQSRSEEKHREIIDVIQEGQESFTEFLLALVHEGDLNELQLLNAKYKAKETTSGWQTIIRSRMAQVQDHLALWSRFGWKKIKSTVHTLGIFLGFLQKEMEETKRADIATYLSETDQKMQELPYIYRRLFNFDAKADQRFYVQALDSASILKKAYGQWQQSFPSTLAVVGEKGSGKSTFLNLTLEAEISDNQLIQLTMHDTIWTEDQLVEVLGDGLGIKSAQSIQEVVEIINGWSNRKVICIECIQNCFIRNLNGYEVIEKLCYLISETKNQVFWVVSCSRYSWRFLDKTVQLSDYFSHLTTTDRLDADQIKRVILNRHRSSGYTLHFEVDDDTIKPRSYRKLMDDEEKAQEYLQENYFEKLTELAEGNASVAMIFWIRSIREFDDTYCYIQPLEVTSVEMIKDLDPQVLFTLAAFVLHDTISDEDLSMIMHLTKEESRLMINRLQSRGLLVEKDGAYGINHLMYRQIVRVLKERNIIHLV